MAALEGLEASLVRLSATFAAAPNTAILAGLVAGATISVRARVSFPQAFTLGRASVDGSILFLR